MNDVVNDLLQALECRLQSLRLAGVRRVPRLLAVAESPAPAAAPSEPARQPASGPQQFGSMADFARQMRERLGTAAGARQPAASPGAPPPSAAPSAAKPAARGPAASAAPAARAKGEPQADDSLRPQRRVDAKIEKELAALAKTVAACKRCKELAASRTQTVFSDGPSNADLMFIGEAPGQDEDAQGVPFVGRAGQLLTRIITGGMLMRREDVYIGNILKCRPPGNRNPNPDEAAHCREFLDRQIDLVAPKVICCLGGIASRFLLDDPTPVGRMRGRWYQYRGVPVRVTYHPAYLLRNYTKDAREKVWDDVKQVTAKLRELRDRPAGGPAESDDSMF